MPDGSSRLREHPSVRFAEDEQVFDIEQAAADLVREPDEPRHQGHREMAIFRHGPMTVGLFCFNEGSKIPDHVLDGNTTIHVLEGRLTVHASQSHTLKPGSIMALKPNVKHDIEADQPTKALITFCLEP
ncbi:MAG: cupin domain-containing protein [Phycisphaeraceae bacterium]